MIYKITIKHLIKRPFSSFVTLLAIASALTILGSVWTLRENLENVKVAQAEASKEGPNGLTLFVDPTLPKKDFDSLINTLKEKKWFADVQIVPPEQALESLEAQFGETLTKVFGEESLPTTVKLYFSVSNIDRESFYQLANEIRALPGVLDLDDGIEVIPGSSRPVSQKVFSWATGFLLLVFLIVSLLVSHIIRLVFESMRPEIETLKVLGASKSWIFVPLMTQGFIFGILGTLVSLGAVGFFVEIVVPQYLQSFLPKGVEMISLSSSSILQLSAVGILSAVVGALFTWPLVAKPAQEMTT